MEIQIQVYGYIKLNTLIPNFIIFLLSNIIRFGAKKALSTFEFHWFLKRGLFTYFFTLLLPGLVNY